jgi:hypothetical protein
MQRLRESLDTRNQPAGRGYDIRYSVGQTGFNPQRHAVVADLLAQADAAMYANRQASRLAQPNRR